MTRRELSAALATLFPVVVVSSDGVVKEASDQAAQLLTAATDPIVPGTRFTEFFDDETARCIALYLGLVTELPDGRGCAYEVPLHCYQGVRTIHMDALKCLGSQDIELNLSDVTNLRSLQRSELDCRTGLPGRLALDKALKALAFPHLGCAVLVAVRSLKAITVTFGVDAESQALMKVASCLLGAFPTMASAIVRTGTDELAVILPNLRTATVSARLELVQENLNSLGPIGSLEGLDPRGLQIARRLSLDGPITVAAGIAETDGTVSPEELIRHAGEALASEAWQPHRSGEVGDSDDAVRLRRREEELLAARAERDRAEREARTDALTGLPNRRAYNERLTLVERLGKAGVHNAVIFYDADDFHALNRERGDAIGDEVLHQLARIFSETCRTTDTVFRKGGEEFVVLLSHSTIHEAIDVAERTRQAVESAAIASGTPNKVVTISAGVACYHPDLHKDMTEVVEKAADAMREAKDAGRNRVRLRAPCLHDSDAQTANKTIRGWATTIPLRQ